MDAALRFLKTMALFLGVVLFGAMSGRAQQLTVSSNRVNLITNQALSVNVMAAGSDAVNYTVSTPPFWLTITSSNNLTTPDTLFFQLANTNCGSCQTSITLSAAGSQPVTIA